jgi:hypothetical protein
MDKLTHFTALRAAARVAFGIAVLGGCTAAATEEDSASTESDIKAKKAKAEDDCPSHEDAGAKPDAKPSCENVLASAFPDGGSFMDMQNPPQVSDEVKTCCVEHLTSESEETWKLQYRWSCCGVLDNWNNPDPKISMACTPWGPPVPPSMKRRRTSLSTMGVA